MKPLSYQRTVLAYHGCDASTAVSVLEQKAGLQESENAYDWLGTGIYFWEHGPLRAWQWANWRSQMKSERIKKPAVVGAVLHLGNCFDLLDTANTKLLEDLFPEFEKALASEGKELPLNKGVRGTHQDDLVLRFLDCAVVNWTLKRLENEGLYFDTVRCAFNEGGPAFPGSMIRKQSHIQIAVRNPDVIVGYFLPAVDFLQKSKDQ